VDPARPDALINCGTLYYEDGNLEKASEYFRQALVLDQESALAHFNLGSVLDETGHVDAARQHLRQAVRLNPIYPDAHYNLAFVCEKLKAYAEARATLAGVCETGPHGSLGELRAPTLHFFQGDKVHWNNLRTHSDCSQRNKAEFPPSKGVARSVSSSLI